ncbi:GAF domain-containing protein [bacterium]|nr:GAF domain-containing protein [bacterium]
MMTKADRYTASLRELDIRLAKGGDPIADLGNTAAVLKKRLDYYWIGFYFLRSDRLILGPFQGTPACVFLSLDKGVCAEAVKRQETVIVQDVRDFPGHVACDPKSRSEIVVPCFDTGGRLRAVLDLDHTEKSAFDDTDRKNLLHITGLLTGLWTSLPL